MGFSKLLGTAVLTTKKYSPEIKFIFGVLSLGAALYTTHKSALKCQKILEEKKLALQQAEDETRKEIEDVKAGIERGEIAPEEYTEADEKADFRKTRMQVNVTYGVQVVKNYALPAFFTGAAIFCFHGAMMDYKNLAAGIGAAYSALMMKHDDIMKYIKNQLGDEKFKELQEGFKAEQIKNAQSTGLTDPIEKADARAKMNPYSRFFDELHGSWTGSPEVDKMWLLGKENILNARLQRNGFLFLNDAYEEMGYKPTDAGRVMGWLAKKSDGSTNYIDFGIFNIHDTAARWFVNGLEPVFLINFNVDPQPITGRIGWAKY